jgi:hypothetical protein
MILKERYMTSDPDLERYMQRTSFWERGCQYYIAGRFAVSADLNPVAGNVLHHAVEFLLKGALSKTRTLRELRQHLHALPQLWEAFKAESGDASLTKFDPAVTALHAYEDLRYPDKVLKKGMGSMISSHRSQLPPEMAAEMERRRASLPSVPEYALCLQDIDELVEAIFAAAKTNPRFFFNGKNPKAVDALVDGNKATGLLK